MILAVAYPMGAVSAYGQLAAPELSMMAWKTGNPWQCGWRCWLDALDARGIPRQFPGDWTILQVRKIRQPHAAGRKIRSCSRRWNTTLRRQSSSCGVEG